MRSRQEEEEEEEEEITACGAEDLIQMKRINVNLDPDVIIRAGFPDVETIVPCPQTLTESQTHITPQHQPQKRPPAAALGPLPPTESSTLPGDGNHARSPSSFLLSAPSASPLRW